MIHPRMLRNPYSMQYDKASSDNARQVALAPCLALSISSGVNRSELLDCLGHSLRNQPSAPNRTSGAGS